MNDSRIVVVEMSAKGADDGSDAFDSCAGKAAPSRELRPAFCLMIEIGPRSEANVCGVVVMQPWLIPKCSQALGGPER